MYEYSKIFKDWIDCLGEIKSSAVKTLLFGLMETDDINTYYETNFLTLKNSHYILISIPAFLKGAKSHDKIDYLDVLFNFVNFNVFNWFLVNFYKQY